MQNHDTLNAIADDDTAATVVKEVRSFIQQMSRTSTDQDCVVCFVLRGVSSTKHRSGLDCPEGICHGESTWKEFLSTMKFDNGRSICYYCYLPTVSF